jgi:hypothetical protein
MVSPYEEIMILGKTGWHDLRTWIPKVRKGIGPIHSIWHPGSLPLTTGGQPSDGSSPILHDHATE